MGPKRSAGVGRWKLTGKAIGEGGQAHVLEVIDRQGEYSGEYAIKRFKNELRRGRIDNEILRTRNLFTLGAPVLQVIDDYLVSEPDASVPWYVSPYMRSGNLKKRLRPGECYGGAEQAALQFYEQLVRAILSLHAHKTAHRDLKPENVLFDEAGNSLLCDLGLCLPLDEDIEAGRRTEELERIGSIHYTPMEAFAGPQPAGRNQFAYDVFAMGKILYEVLVGRVLPGFVKPHSSDYDLVEVRRGRCDVFYAEANTLLEAMLHDNPEVRLSVWENGAIESNIEALKHALLPREEGASISEFRHRLAIATDNFYRRDHEGIRKETYRIEEIQQRIQEISGRVTESWRTDDLVKELQGWSARNEQVACIEISTGQSRLVGMLAGPYVHSDFGTNPLEERGWSARSEAETEAVIGLKPRSDGSLDSLWLVCSVFFGEGRLVALFALIHQEHGSRGRTDILKDTLHYSEGGVYDVAFEREVLKHGHEAVKQWAEMAVGMIEKCSRL